MRDRRGWTLIEIMIVMVILGLLSGLAVLKYIDLTRTAFAAKIAGEFTVVRLAAYNYEADHHEQWPAEVGPGIMPPEMVPYMPAGFAWTTPTYQLDWDNRSPSRDPYQIAISLTTTDPRLMNALSNTLGGRAPYVIAGNRLTYVLIDRSGNY